MAGIGAEGARLFLAKTETVLDANNPGGVEAEDDALAPFDEPPGACRRLAACEVWSDSRFAEHLQSEGLPAAFVHGVDEREDLSLSAEQGAGFVGTRKGA